MEGLRAGVVVYVPLDVSYADDPKIIAAGEKAELLYIRGLAMAKRLPTDGVIHDNHLPRFGLAGVTARAAKLVEVGLWERIDGGYRITTWLKHNRSVAELEELREKRRQAGKQSAQHRAQQSVEQDVEQDAEHSPPPRQDKRRENNSPSSVVHLHPPGRNGCDEDELWSIYAERKLTEVLASGGSIGNTEAWKEATAKDAKAKLSERSTQLDATYHLTPIEKVDVLLGRTNVLRTARRR